MISVDPDKSPKGFSVVRLERNGVDLKLDPVNPAGFIVSPADVISGLRVVIGCGDATLRGRVRSPQGILPENSLVTVEAKPISRDATPSKAEADWQGRFALEGLSNGDYELVIKYFCPGFQSGARTERVTVAEGKITTTTFVLDLKPLTR